MQKKKQDNEETEKGEEQEEPEDIIDYDVIGTVVDKIVETAQKQKSVQQEEATTLQEAATEYPITDSFDEVLCRETERIEKEVTEKKKKEQSSEVDVHTIERNIKKNKRPITKKDESFVYETPEEIKKKTGKKRYPKEKVKCHKLRLKNVKCNKKNGLS